MNSRPGNSLPDFAFVAVAALGVAYLAFTAVSQRAAPITTKVFEGLFVAIVVAVPILVGLGVNHFQRRKRGRK